MSASSYSEEEIEAATQRSMVRIQTTAVRATISARDTAKLLADQKVIGWFQGGRNSVRARSAIAACSPIRARPR